MTRDQRSPPSAPVVLLVLMVGASVSQGTVVYGVPLWFAMVAGLGVLFFGLRGKPERIVYAYLAVKILFPKMQGVTIVEEAGRIRGSMIVAADLAMAGALLVSLFTHRREAPRGQIPRESRALLWLLVLMYTISTYAPAFFHGVGLEVPGEREAIVYGDRPMIAIFAGFAYTVSALIALYATMRFIDSSEKIERYLKVVIVCGLVGALEGFATWYLHLLPGLSAHVAVDQRAAFRLGTVTVGSYDWIGRWLVYTLIAGLGLLSVRRRFARYVFLPMLPIVVLVIFGTLSRTVMIGASLGVIGFAYLRWTGGRHAVLRTVAFAGLLAAVVTMAMNAHVLSSFNDLAISQRASFADYNNLRLRTELAEGVWPIMYRHLLIGTGTDSAQQYALLATGLRQSVHNMYLHFLLEQGLLGWVTLGSMLFIVIWNAVRSRSYSGAGPRYRRLRALEAIVYSTLFSAAIMVWTDSTFLVIFFYWTMIHFTSVLRGLVWEETGVRWARPPALLDMRPATPRAPVSA